MGGPNAGELAVLEGLLPLPGGHGPVCVSSDETEHVVLAAPHAEGIAVRAIAERQPAKEAFLVTEVLFYGGEVLITPLGTGIVSKSGVKQGQRTGSLGT